jgi:transketolase
VNNVTDALLAELEVVDAPFATALARGAKAHPEMVVLSADLSKYTDVLDFAVEYPERFVQVGMAEQNLMGIAAGLAKSGHLPVITTYCVFATRRAYEQVALALNTGDRPFVIAAFLPGLTTPFRATHQGTDDLALMRNIPGLTVIDPMDATELTDALCTAMDSGRRVYLRGLRGQVRRTLDPDRYRFQIGAAAALVEGTDVGIIGSGLGTQWALEAAKVLSERGVDAGILHVPTIKPLDDEAVLDFCQRYQSVATIENHARSGGLGTAVAELLSDRGVGVRLCRLGVPDYWPPAGSLDYIRARLGLDADGLATSIEAAMTARLVTSPTARGDS